MTIVRHRGVAQTSEQLTYAHASTAATLVSDVGFVVPTGGNFTLDRVLYVNPTGLAASGSNFFTINVLAGATVMASFATSATALAAGVTQLLVNSATPANLTAASGVSLRLQLVLTGTATLPAGQVRIEGRLL